MDRSTASGSAQAQFDRWVPRLLTLMASLILLARLWLVFQRLYDPDELQHLHAGYCVWRGMVPYRDFFEQHQPVLWYLSIPLFHIWGASLRVLFSGRLLIWFMGAVTAGLTFRLGTRLFGRFAGATAALLLLIHPPYQEKNVEWRPDNVAVPLLLGAIVCIDRAVGPNARRWAALAGVLIASAFFCTQKVAYAALGIILALAWASLRDRDATGQLTTGRRWSRSGGIMAALVAGAVLVTTVVIGFIYQQGAIASYLDMTVIAPIRWQTREPAQRFLVGQLTSGAVFWSTGVAGWILAAAELRTRQRSAGVAAIVGGACTHSLGLLHVPAAFHQYYLPLSPLVAVLAAHAVAELANYRGTIHSRKGRVLATLAGLAIAAVALTMRTQGKYLSDVWVLIMAAVLILAAVLCVIGHRIAAALLTIMASAIGAISYHNIQYRYWNHEQQTRCIERLMNATEPDDPFFDGFTGYGALRPHAFYVFWINHHSWPMIPAEHKLQIIDALQNPRTRVVLLDENLIRLLPPDARQVIERYYEPDLAYSQFPIMVVYARRDRPLPKIGNLGVHWRPR